MNYQELVAKEGHNKINYGDLLITLEWSHKRKSIINRDRCCCISCGLSSTMFESGFNIAFQMNDNLFSSSVDYVEEPIEVFKSNNNIKSFDVLKSPHIDEAYCAISTTGKLLLVNHVSISNLKTSSQKVINKEFTKNGLEVWILGIKGEKYSSLDFRIPTITDFSLVMHVHHKLYIKERLPWEYNDSDLITLCNRCHADLHAKNRIPIYTIINGQYYNLDYNPCNRCNGVGIFSQYKHVEGGVCFKCKGNRYEELIDNH